MYGNIIFPLCKYVADLKFHMISLSALLIGCGNRSDVDRFSSSQCRNRRIYSRKNNVAHRVVPLWFRAVHRVTDTGGVCGGAAHAGTWGCPCRERLGVGQSGQLADEFCIGRRVAGDGGGGAISRGGLRGVEWSFVG